MASFKKAYHANCWGALGGDAVGVTSIAQLTYRTFGDMETAIRQIGEAGYAGTELFDGNLLDHAGSGANLSRVLESAGVRLVAAYSGANFIFEEILEEELVRIRRTADAAAALGAEHLVVGGGAKRAAGSRPDDIGRLGAALDKVVSMARERGLAAHYHPHLTTIVETPSEVAAIFKETSIGFCPDTAHLAAAGADVPAVLGQHRDRISYVHLKGLRRQPFAFTPIDEGDIDMTAVIQTLRSIDYQGWVTVELDSWPDPKQGAERSMAFLRRHESRA